MPANQQIVRAAVSVSQMARILGLSRSRFYVLMTKGVFLPPVYSVATKRAHFPRELQERNLQVRVEQIGVNGEFVLFQERHPAPQGGQSARSSSRQGARVTTLVLGLKSLGLETVNAAVVERALAASYPQGTNGTDETTILRTVFRYLRRSGTV